MLTDLQDRLDIAREKAGVVGASLAVLHDGHITAVASGPLNKNTGVEARPDSLFQIGSITKTYTATLIMQLVEQGLIDLDTRVVDVVEEFRILDESVLPQITVRHLLTHTSGFDGDHFHDTGRGDDALERYAESCATLTQTTPLGTLFSYNNAGFSVLGRVIEKVTGETWDEALRTRLLEPLGLTHTVTLPEDVLRFGAALGHLGPDLDPSPQWGLPRAVGPAGLICSTASDVVTYAAMHFGGTDLLSQTSVSAMQTHHATIPGPIGGLLPTSVGLSWMFSDHGAVRVFGHDGGTIGQSARLRFVPSTRTAVAMLTNGGDLMAISTLVDELLEELAGATTFAPLQPLNADASGHVERWVGRYSRNNQAATVRIEDGRLFADHEMLAGEWSPSTPPASCSLSTPSRAASSRSSSS